jgi:hypothetical protein
MWKKLLRLDDTFKVVRHIMEPCVQTLMGELTTMLESGGTEAADECLLASARSSEGDREDGIGRLSESEVLKDAEVQTDSKEVQPFPNVIRGVAAGADDALDQVVKAEDEGDRFEATRFGNDSLEVEHEVVAVALKGTPAEGEAGLVGPRRGVVAGFSSRSATRPQAAS